MRTACAPAWTQLADWGAPDIVINNAGVTVTKPLLEQTEADFDQVMDTNLKGCWLVATEAARRMVAAGQGGSIVNVASILGERVAGGVAPYAISKAGVIQADQGDGSGAGAPRHPRQRVAARLCGDRPEPRVSRTARPARSCAARIPSRRFGELADLDGPLLLLASDAGAAMSGSTVAVDGAHLVSSL